MNKTKIGTFEAILIVLSFLAPFTIMSLPRTILNETKSSSLLNIVYVTIICIFIAFLIYKLFKKFPGFDILDLANSLGGAVFKNIIGLLFISFFIITAAILLRSFCESLRVVYYPLTDIVYIILVFIISISISNHLGFSSSLRTTTLISVFVVISVVLLFVGNLNNLSFGRIFPILGDGFSNTFAVGLINIGCFSGITYLYFLPPLLKKPEKFKHISIISVLLSGLFILLCVGTLLFMFSIFISVDEIMPLFIASRYIEFGSFFQRFESLFLLIWIISFCCYLSITCKFSSYIFTKIFNLKDSSPLVYPFAFLVFAISLIPKNYAITNIFETSIYRYLSIGIIILGISILIISNIKKKVGDSN